MSNFERIKRASDIELVKILQEVRDLKLIPENCGKDCSVGKYNGCDDCEYYWDNYHNKGQYTTLNDWLNKEE